MKNFHLYLNKYKNFHTAVRFALMHFHVKIFGNNILSWDLFNLLLST